MLKACWDCLVGNEARPEEGNSIQLNGNVSRAPPWPTPQLTNEKMFLLPRQLEPRDKITVKCETFEQPGILNIGLVTGNGSPDYSNLACELKLSLPPQYQDSLQVAIIENGQPEVVHQDNATNYFGDTNFTLAFRMRNSSILDIIIAESVLTSIQLKHSIESIRFLTVNGDINKVLGLDFQFGN